MFLITEQLDIVSQELEVVAAWLQTYIDRISEYVAAHPTMATLKSIHSTTMDTFNSYSDAAVTKVSAVASPEMYTNAIYGVHTSVNNALKSLETSTFDMTYLIGLSDSMMYKVKFYYDYYDIPDHVKNFAIHSKNVAAEYLNDYLNHYVDQMLNDFKVRTTPTIINTDSFMRRNDVQQKIYNGLIFYISVSKHDFFISVGCL